MQVNVHEAKSRLSELGKLVLKGVRMVIAKARKPYLDVLSPRQRTEPRTPGRLKGRIHMAPDFDQTPEEVVGAFGDD